jgi:Mrp family chromosome partitioning ATPase
MRARTKPKANPPLHAVAANPVGKTDYALDPDLLFNNRVVGFDPPSEDVHPFFILRSQLLKHVQFTRQHVIAVTSVQPGNGKTHISVNLAAALGRIRPTVLVELDLRRPSIGQRLGLPSDQPGIDDYLAGDAELGETGVQISGTKLTVHAVRRPHTNPENLLASARLIEMTSEIRKADDQTICIIDTPPAVIHDDIMLIAPAIDGIIMVVQEARTSKQALINTIRSLNPTPVIGSVLNMSISAIQQKNDYGEYYTPRPTSNTDHI